MAQKIIRGRNSYTKVSEILFSIGCKKFLLVCDPSFSFLSIKDYFDDIDIPHVKFNDFTSNPLYEDVCKGINLFNTEGCDVIIAIGGGSAIDVAKCIKLYCKMGNDQNYLLQEYKDSGIPLIALPTTAGTGSESTRYAVIYFEGKKQSITHDSIIPDYAILEHSLLKTLPIYQKKCTILDALCHGIESWWSVNSNKESKAYSKIAIETIIMNMDAYIISNTDKVAEKIMLAANYAGRAICITQTTAAHAMSYKLTSFYNLPHGHAVAICLPEIWTYMIDHLDRCIDSRGVEYVTKIFDEIANSMGGQSPIEAIKIFRDIMFKLQMMNPVAGTRNKELDLLAQSVNPIRLKNNPLILDYETIHSLYEKIVK